MKKMFFPKNVNVGKTGYIAGEINEVVETPGSVTRWLIRGCTIVEEKKEVKPVEIKEEIKEEVKEEKIIKPVRKPSRRRSDK